MCGHTSVEASTAHASQQQRRSSPSCWVGIWRFSRTCGYTVPTLLLGPALWLKNQTLHGIC